MRWFEWWRDKENREGVKTLFEVLKIAVPAGIAAIAIVAGWFYTKEPVKPDPKPAGDTITVTGGGAVSTGSGTAISTGDQSPVTVIQGYTIEQHEAALARREATLRADLGRAHQSEIDLIEQQLAEVERQKSDLQASHDARVRELADLRLRLADVGAGIPEERIQAAQQALYEGDASKADAIFAEVEAMEADSISRAAKAAFQRGG
jgi:hypothetical protein